MKSIIKLAENNNLEEIQSILSEKQSQKDLDLALVMASQAGHDAIAAHLLSAGAATTGKRAASALIQSAQNGHLAVVELLLAHGIDPNSRESFTQRPALHFAAEQGHANIIKSLTAAGAKVDVQDPDGETALMRAALNGHLDAVGALLNAGANPNLRARDQTTAIENAQSRGHKKIVQMLQSTP